jgi:phosphate uptake regulator
MWLDLLAGLSFSAGGWGDADAQSGRTRKNGLQVRLEVRASDDEVDAINRKLFQEFAAAVRRNPEHVESLLSYLSVGRHLERIADYATNIAEDVIYLMEGEIVRHKPTLPEK